MEEEECTRACSRMDVHLQINDLASVVHNAHILWIRCCLLNPASTLPRTADTAAHKHRIRERARAWRSRNARDVHGGTLTDAEIIVAMQMERIG